jgi:predicted PurR-regulated permease PerM
MKETTQWSLTFRYVAGILLFAAFVAFAFYAHEAVRNFIIAGFIAYLLHPAVYFLQTRLKMKHTSAVNVVFFTAIILLVGIPAAMTPVFYDEARIVVEDLLDLSRQLSVTLSQPVRFGTLVFHLEGWSKSLSELENAFLAPLPQEFLSLLETTSVGVLWFLVIVVSVYLLLRYWYEIRVNLFSFVLPPYRAELEELYTRIKNIWMAYLRGQIVLMLVVGVIFTIVWLILGIPGALVLGLVAGLFTLVPDVGPFLAVLLAAGVALLEGSTWIPLSNFWVAGIVIVVYLILISIKNLFLRPLIMGRSVHMNEGLVFIIIIVATILEGILGALLVVPLVASAAILLRYLSRKILGLPPFAEEDALQFVAPPEKINPPNRARLKLRKTKKS